MNGRAPKLRSLLTATTVVVVALAVVVAAALIVLTSLLHRVTVNLGASLESVRLAEEAQVALLLHGRVQDTLARRDIEGNLRRKLADAERFVVSEHKQGVLQTAMDRVEDYVSASQADRVDSGERLDAAYEALDTLVNSNVLYARAEQARAARFDRLANAIGLAVASLGLVVATVVVFWVRVSAFRPMWALAQAMDRFRRGDRSARAEEAGAAELRDVARQFNEMAATLSDQREAQLAFLGGVAHDLRTPLAALRLSADFFGPDQPLPPEPAIRRTLGVVSRQVTRLERMVNDFVDRAQIEAGRLELRIERRNAGDAMREVARLFEGTSEQHALELSVVEDIEVNGDPLRIEQVLINLVSNAIKYSPAGGTIRLSVERSGSEAIFVVADPGVGISDEDLEHLFDPFRRGRATHDLAPGVGLGLFVSRKIVQAHGGRIEVTSQPGRGSIFRVCLPIAQGIA